MTGRIRFGILPALLTHQHYSTSSDYNIVLNYQQMKKTSYRVDEKSIARLDIDTGGGFQSGEKLVQVTAPFTQSISFDLSTVESVIRLRFLPVNKCCVLRLYMATLQASTGSIFELNPCQTNAAVNDHLDFFFDSQEPFIQFEAPAPSSGAERFDRFVASLCFLGIGKEQYGTQLKRHLQKKAKPQQNAPPDGGNIKVSANKGPFTFLTYWKNNLKQLYWKLRQKAISGVFSLTPVYRAIDQSGLFDRAFYFANNLDLNQDLVDPIVHYIRFGHFEGRNPNPLLETTWYWQEYPYVAKKKQNPLYHYVTTGWREGYNPCTMFENNYYAYLYPEVKERHISPLAHYCTEGVQKGYRPNPFFDTAFYLEQGPDVRESGENPLVHYIRRGYWEGRPTCRLDQIQFRKRPLISILTPVYNVPEPYLRACIGSVLKQQYDHWELCLVDDASSAAHIKPLLEEFAALDSRIKVRYQEENQGIAGATNAAAEIAKGEYFAFLDNDDELTRNALVEMVRALNEQAADLLYSDECIVDEDGEYLAAHHKPDFSPDLLLSHNYITHFLVLHRDLFTSVGGLDSTCDGAQDYDLLLKATEQAQTIAHIPKILYRWRTIETSTSANPEAKSYAAEAGRHALEQALQRRSIDAEVHHGNLPFYYRVQRKIEQNPLVSIIIPFRNQPEFLNKCVTSLLERTRYENFEIIGVSNNSTDAITFSLMEHLSSIDERVKFIEYNNPFNYSAVNNFGVSQSQGEHLVLMNNDIEVLNQGWLEALLEHSQRPEVGAVGAKLYYPNNTIQHAGVVVGIGGFAGHIHRNYNRNSSGYFNKLNCTHNVSAVTAALLMVSRIHYDDVDGFDENNLGVALNDVDFCLKLRAKGLLNIFTPYPEAIHYESASRGYEESPEKKERFLREVSHFQKKWKLVLLNGDPYYNPNLSLDSEDFSREKYLCWYDSKQQRKVLLLSTP